MNDKSKLLSDLQRSVPDCSYHVNVGLGFMLESLKQYDVDLNPEYQRDYVWNEEQQTIFMGSLLRAPRLIPPLWFRWTDKKFRHSDSEVLDGKQRIKAATRWLNNEIPAVFTTGDIIWYSDLGDIGRRNVYNNVMFSWNFVDLSIKDTYKFYLLLNSGGTKHTPEELAKVRKLLEKCD